MRTVIAVLAPGAFAPVASVTLAADERHRRRIRMVDDDGRDFLLDLAKATHLKDGDGLVLEHGGIIVVRAADEEVVDIACADSAELARLAWHVGNRHTPVQFLPEGGLRIAADPVLIAMLEGLGAAVTRRRAPFQPEPGAYDPHGLLAAPPPALKWG